MRRKRCKYVDTLEGRRCRRDDPHAFGTECRMNVAFTLITFIEGEETTVEFASRKERAAYKQGWLDAMRRSRNHNSHGVRLIKPW